MGGFRGSFSVRGNSDAAMHQDDLFLDDDLGLDIAPASDMRFSDGPSRQPPAPSARSDRTSGVGGAVRDRESAAEVEGEGAVSRPVLCCLITLMQTTASPGRRRRLRALPTR